MAALFTRWKGSILPDRAVPILLPTLPSYVLARWGSVLINLDPRIATFFRALPTGFFGDQSCDILFERDILWCAKGFWSRYWQCNILLFNLVCLFDITSKDTSTWDNWGTCLFTFSMILSCWPSTCTSRYLLELAHMDPICHSSTDRSSIESETAETERILQVIIIQYV